MSSLAQQFPPDDVPEMPVDEVAMRLLTVLVDPERGSFLSRNNVGNVGLWDELQISQSEDHAFLRAIVEAWDRVPSRSHRSEPQEARQAHSDAATRASMKRSASGGRSHSTMAPYARGSPRRLLQRNPPIAAIGSTISGQGC
jgi:hypothetical protein